MHTTMPAFDKMLFGWYEATRRSSSVPVGTVNAEVLVGWVGLLLLLQFSVTIILACAIGYPLFGMDAFGDAAHLIVFLCIVLSQYLILFRKNRYLDVIAKYARVKEKKRTSMCHAAMAVVGITFIVSCAIYMTSFYLVHGKLFG